MATNRISDEQHERADHNLVKAQGILQVVASAKLDDSQRHHMQNAIWAADSLIQEARAIYGEV